MEDLFWQRNHCKTGLSNHIPALFYVCRWVGYICSLKFMLPISWSLLAVMNPAYETTCWKMHSSVSLNINLIFPPDGSAVKCKPQNIHSNSWTFSWMRQPVHVGMPERSAFFDREDMLRRLCWNNYITGWNYKPPSLQILPNGSDFPLQAFLLGCTNNRLPLRWCNNIMQCKANSLSPF